MKRTHQHKYDLYNERLLRAGVQENDKPTRIRPPQLAYFPVITFNRSMALKRYFTFGPGSFVFFLIFAVLSLFLAYDSVKRTNSILSTFPLLHRFQKSPDVLIKEHHITGPLPDIIEYGSRSVPSVALTFDADMTEGMYYLLKHKQISSLYNEDIKRTLDREKAKATIFLSGLWVDAYPQKTKELAADPLIELANHSYSHPAFRANCYDLVHIPVGQARNQVELAQIIINRVAGITPKYFRFPGGCFDPEDLKTVMKLGLKVVHWDVSAGDGFNYNTQSIVNTVLSRVQNGSIIVFHLHGDRFAPKTNDALQEIIPELKKRGFKFVTVSELLYEE
jgi:peptidoglycan-N-acetylglucosamine deacetylase